MLTRLSSTSARITEVGDVAERLAVLFKKRSKKEVKPKEVKNEENKK